MAAQTEKAIKPIKDVVAEIAGGEDVTAKLEKLRKITVKGDFYESHTLFELLDLAPLIDKKRKHEIEEILQFCNELLQHSSKNYLHNVYKICKLIYSLKV